MTIFNKTCSIVCAGLISIRCIAIPLMSISINLIDKGIIPGQDEYLFAVAFAVATITAYNYNVFKNLLMKILSFRVPTKTTQES